MITVINRYKNNINNEVDESIFIAKKSISSNLNIQTKNYIKSKNKIFFTFYTYMYNNFFI